MTRRERQPQYRTGRTGHWYSLENIPMEIWQEFRTKADLNGQNYRWVMIRLMKDFAVNEENQKRLEEAMRTV